MTKKAFIYGTFLLFSRELIGMDLARQFYRGTVVEPMVKYGVGCVSISNELKPIIAELLKQFENDQPQLFAASGIRIILNQATGVARLEIPAEFIKNYPNHVINYAGIFALYFVEIEDCLDIVNILIEMEEFGEIREHLNVLIGGITRIKVSDLDLLRAANRNWCSTVLTGGPADVLELNARERSLRRDRKKVLLTCAEKKAALMFLKNHSNLIMEYVIGPCMQHYVTKDSITSGELDCIVKVMVEGGILTAQYEEAINHGRARKDLNHLGHALIEEINIRPLLWKLIKGHPELLCGNHSVQYIKNGGCLEIFYKLLPWSALIMISGGGIVLLAVSGF